MLLDFSDRTKSLRMLRLLDISCIRESCGGTIEGKKNKFFLNLIGPYRASIEYRMPDSRLLGESRCDNPECVLALSAFIIREWQKFGDGNTMN